MKLLSTMAKAVPLPTDTWLGSIKQYTAAATISVPKVMIINSFTVRRVITNRPSCSYVSAMPYKTIISVPAAISRQPMRDLGVNFSWRNTKARTSVNTTLSLSTGTTLEASPICRAR